MIDFAKDFKAFTEDQKTLGLVATNSFEHYLNKYARTPTTFPVNKILTGYIYTFFYDKKIEKEEDFLNNRPVVFFINAEKSQQRTLISGIDLITMFPNDRLFFLSRITQIFQSHMVHNMNSLNTPRSLPLEYPDLRNFMRGINYTHSFRKWSLDKLKNFHEIPYQEWKYIPYLDTRSMQGLSLSEIYKRIG
jgi:hypothetical protein